MSTNNSPERATISLAVRPLFEKDEMRALRLEAGEGRLEFAALKLAVVESLLPNNKFHVGPPS